MTNVSKVDFLKQSILTQFNSRSVIEANKRGLDFGITMSMEEFNNNLWVKFTKDNVSYSFNVPLPYVENGVMFIEHNEVKRSVCKYWIEESQLMYDYLDVMYQVICGDPHLLIPNNLIKKILFMQQIVYSFENKNTDVVIYNLQKAINEVVNKLPLHDTYMNSLIMNNRIIIIDRVFDELTDPEKKLQYHIYKSKKYFARGWTTIGLSDGSLADKNYILATDLKKFTPFGEKYHNPQRNLYSTLGMKGDDLPLICSESMESLHKIGIARKGWNMFTLFVDVKDVWEDQILISAKAAKKAIEYSRRIQCYGEIKVAVGSRLYPDRTILSVAADGKPRVFDIPCDKAWVSKLSEAIVNVGGVPTKVTNVVVSYIRKLKDGVKITNTAANKGVIRIMETLGHAVDPRDGKIKEIEVIVSSKAVRKRKNFTQILEALLNNVTDEKGVIVGDYECPTLSQIKTKLVEKGFPEDGTWQCYTPYGELVGICGKVFWGVTHDVEDMLWTLEDTTRTNTRDLRTAGLKFSTVEFRALDTRFGKDNAITQEILSYIQGSSQLHEYLNILESKRANINPELEVVNVFNINPVDQSEGTIVDSTKIIGTIADVERYPDSFILELPVEYQVAVNMQNDVITEGFVNTTVDIAIDEEVQYVVKFNKLYVPTKELRECWRHDTSKLGLSEMSALLNNIVVLSHRLKAEPEVAVHTSTLYKVIYNYFNVVANKMGTKNGELSTYGMSVRYPFSAKAVATLSNSLPKNTIEIYKETAELIGVNEGDVVLVERFPCMGFMSLRPQKVHITHNSKCKYTIRASGNCLGSMTLDFDGDVLYIAAFHTPEAKEALLKEWTNPNQACYDAILELNAKMGTPSINELTLEDYEIVPFDSLNTETHASIVDKATGVKSHTGPVIAFAYNIMRMMENSSYADDRKISCAVEIFLDKVGNSIFKQKHGVKALHAVCVDAICTGDVETLVKEGFSRSTSTIICNVVKEKAAALGVKESDLVYYHEKIHKEYGKSNIISKIVRATNKVYHASRSTYEGIKLLSLLQQPAVDIPSRILAWSLSGKANNVRTPMYDILDKRMSESKLYTPQMRRVADALMDSINELFFKAKPIVEDTVNDKVSTNLLNRSTYGNAS